MNSLPQLALRARLLIARLGWLHTTALVMLVLGAVGGAAALAYLQRQTQEPLRSLQRAEQALQAAKREPEALLRSLPEQRLKAYYDNLGERRYAEQQVKALFAIAAKTGLTLYQAEYRAIYDKASRVTAYQVSLPVKGSYGAIRQFCEQVLLAIPFASLDEIGFKREAISSSALEAKARFTLYLGEGKMAAAAATATAAGEVK